MAAGAEAPSLTIDDALEVLDKLGAERLERLILVGGQAAAFWIARYGIADPRLVTTKDIDVLIFERQPRVALECAGDLGGELLTAREPRVPDVARVRFNLRGAELQIDFLRSLHGVSAAEVVSSKLGVVGELASGKTLYVVHPVFSLASRLFNTFELPGRLTEQNLLGVRLSIDAVRAYLADQPSVQETTSEDVLPSIERIFGLAVCRAGLTAWRSHAIDLFHAVPDKSDLSRCPRQFLEKRYPQMRRSLETKRKTASKARRSTRTSTRIKRR